MVDRIYPEKAADEYLKAWFILHLLEEIFPLTPMKSGKSFIFNMSVGYNLDGIKQPPMQQFINTMMNASKQPEFSLYRDILDRWLHDERFLLRFPGDDIRPRLDTLAHRIPATTVHSVTLSTMHGCPPDEIEAICRYMLEEKTSIPSSNSTRRFSAIPGYVKFLIPAALAISRSMKSPLTMI